MSHFDATDLWMGSSDKENASARVSSVNGFSVATNEEFQEPKSYAMKDGDLLLGALWSNGTDIHLDGNNAGIQLFTSDNIRLLRDNAYLDIGDNIVINPSLGEVVINSLPTSEPTGPNRLYTQTATELGGTGSEKVLCVSEGSPPSVPSQPTVCREANTLKISWNSVSGADDYDVSRSVGGGSYSVWKSSIAGTFVRDFDPQNNPDTTYSYRVRACNAQGCSSWSSSQSTTFNNATEC